MTKKPSLEETMAQLEDKFGDSAPFKGSDRDRLKIDYVSTGLISVDLAVSATTGSGGIPMGRVVEAFGPQSSGKTTLALSTIAQAQKKGLNCAFFDNENAFNPDFAEMLGVDVDNLYVAKVTEGELTYDMVEAMAKSGNFALIVVDSIAALAPLPELQSDMGDQHMGLAGKMNSKAMRKLKGTLGKNNCTLFLINQLREKVGQLYGNPETTPGGRAIKFFADLRLDVRVRESYSTGQGDTLERFGHKMRVRIKKNKVGVSGKQAFADLYYDRGFDLEKDLLNAGVLTGVIEKSGGWHSFIPLGANEDGEYEGEKVEIKENGKANFMKALRSSDNTQLIFKEINERILNDVTEPIYLADRINGEDEVDEPTKKPEAKAG